MDQMNADYEDFRVICPDDCGNAPKKRVLKEFIIACAKKDIGVLTEYSAENIEWTFVNDTVVQGREKIIQEIETKLTKKIIEVEILNIITHGHTAAANGKIELEDHSIYSFCHVYRFVSPGKNKIKEITSYVLKTK